MNLTTSRFAFFSLSRSADPRHLHSFPTRRSFDLARLSDVGRRDRDREDAFAAKQLEREPLAEAALARLVDRVQLLLTAFRSEEHTSELQSRLHLVCRLLLEKKNKIAVSICIRDIT